MGGSFIVGFEQSCSRLEDFNVSSKEDFYISQNQQANVKFSGCDRSYLQWPLSAHKLNVCMFQQVTLNVANGVHALHSKLHFA